MNIEELLDQLLVPRDNGSEGLVETAAFIQTTVQAHAPEVELQTFIATPYGIELMISTAFVLVLAFAIAMLRGRYGIALLLSIAVTVLMITEGLMWSPVGGLLPLAEQNIVATFPGRIGAPTLVFSAHYDTMTMFGDHYSIAIWAPAMGIGMTVAQVLPLVGLWQRHIRRRSLPRAVTMTGAAFVVVPFSAMMWLLVVGAVMARPSVGAIDNGGSVAVMLRLAEDLASRPTGAPMTIKLVFLAAEEEGGQGSWHYATTLAADSPTFVINLDNLGVSEQFVYGAKEGFVISHYPPSDVLVDLLNKTARELGDEPLLAMPYPMGTMTDARSFLAQGIPSLTLGSTTDGRWPSHLHSAHDSRDRVSIPALEHSLELLKAVVARVDREPLLGKPHRP
ncbi:MAG: M20/M25/M40 family metallo-hydrolase [Acidiferrobacterales bacterium]